jgi:hypothetical protein
MALWKLHRIIITKSELPDNFGYVLAISCEVHSCCLLQDLLSTKSEFSQKEHNLFPALKSSVFWDIMQCSPFELSS